ncbi:MAG: T9SS type A sorting domain-containing protein, partial [Bacteroidetes bacterium]|nr:T9SS type A sorting domain-containing protein [Bacteroidota bacterium]
FDEEIEENTLATNDCYIADGSGHGGLSTGALIARDGVSMTLWTDPNYGESSTTGLGRLYLLEPTGTASGQYFASLNEGSLIFQSDGLKLDLTPTSAPGHTQLFTFPACRFAVGTGVTDGGKVNVGPGGSWEFFGDKNSSAPVPGVTYLGGGGSIPYYASLRIHGGAQFPAISLTGSYADIEIMYEQSIRKSTTENKPGILSIATDGNSLAYCAVNAHIPVLSTELPVTVVSISGTGTSTSGTTLYSHNTDYTNVLDPVTLTGGFAQVGFGSPGLTAPDKAVFDGGSSSRFAFIADDPTFGYRVQNMTFSDFYVPAILVERQASSTAGYDNVEISGNSFADRATSGGTQFHGTVWAKNFNIAGDEGQLNLLTNQFVSSGHSHYRFYAAIEVENTTGNVEFNQITDQGYMAGIWIHSTGIDPQQTRSYLCNNYIANVYDGDGLDGTGITSEYYIGYVKLNQILDCTRGYSSGYLDQPGLLFSSISSCSRTGIYQGSSTSVVDLTGLHGGGNDIASFDTLQGNGTWTDHGSQIFLYEGALTLLGHLDNAWSHWAENNFIGSTDKHFMIEAGGAGSDLGDIGNNYWGSASVDPNNGDGITGDGVTTGLGLWNTSSSTDSYCKNIAYSTTSTSALTSESGITGISCGGSFQQAGQNSAPRVEKPAVADSCSQWYLWTYRRPENTDEYRMQYDTLRRFIESCANTPGSYHAFATLSGAAQLYDPTDTFRYARFREWLLSVLYLNTTDPLYYCTCVGVMAGTFTFGPVNPPNAALAIWKYLIDSSNCSKSDFQDLYDNTVRSRHDSWLRGDTTIPEDTTLPTLDQLGLDAIRHHVSGVPNSGQLSSTYLASFTGTPNPFTKETELTYVLNRMAYVTVAIYDPLGRMVWGDGKGRSLDAGVHTIRIDGTGLPSGTLYARISTGFGEVKTVKLVHQE